MAKLVDAPASGAGDRKVVGVRVPSWAPNTPLRPYMRANRPISMPSRVPSLDAESCPSSHPKGSQNPQLFPLRDLQDHRGGQRR